MKALFTVILVSFCFGAFAQSQSFLHTEPLNDAQTIDNLDSVFFDLSNAVVIGDTIDLPVSIQSDDVINALDFWLKFDHAKLKYETVLNNTTYMQTLANYVANDSTIHFTSNSFTTYENHPVVLAFVRFTVVSQPVTVTSNDFNSINALLNGEPVTPKMTNGSVVIINGVDDVNNSIDAVVFPSPANNIVTIQSASASWQLFDATGKEVTNSTGYGAKTNLNTSGLANGFYSVRFTSGAATKAVKLVVQHN